MNEVTHINMDIGKRIKELRESSGMSQEELGIAMGGLGKAAVQKIEAGRTKVSADKIKVLCKVFKVLPSALLYDSFLEFWRETFDIELDERDPYIGDLETLITLNALAEARFGSKGVALLHNIDSLNEEGIERAISFVSDLAKISEYRKGGQPD